MIEASELSCMKCSNSFNTAERIPRLLAECGHTLCSVCVEELIKASANGTFECPDDK